MSYWLMKSEPDVFGIDDLKNAPNKTDHWDGIRNYQARNMIRDEMKKGDVLSVSEIAGIQAAKRTSDLIPLCHLLPLTHVSVQATLQ